MDKKSDMKGGEKMANTKRIYIDIDSNVHKTLKMEALKRDVPLKVLIQDLLMDSLKGPKKTKKSK